MFDFIKNAFVTKEDGFNGTGAFTTLLITVIGGFLGTFLGVPGILIGALAGFLGGAAISKPVEEKLKDAANVELERRAIKTELEKITEANATKVSKEIAGKIYNLQVPNGSEGVVKKPWGAEGRDMYLDEISSNLFKITRNPMHPEEGPMDTVARTVQDRNGAYYSYLARAEYFSRQDIPTLPKVKFDIPHALENEVRIALEMPQKNWDTLSQVEKLNTIENSINGRLRDLADKHADMAKAARDEKGDFTHWLNHAKPMLTTAVLSIPATATASALAVGAAGLAIPSIASTGIYSFATGAGAATGSGGATAGLLKIAGTGAAATAGTAISIGALDKLTSMDLKSLAEGSVAFGSHIAASRAYIIQEAAKDFDKNGDERAFRATTEKVAKEEESLNSDTGRAVAKFIRVQGEMKIESKRLLKEKAELDMVKKEWAQKADDWSDSFKAFLISHPTVQNPASTDVSEIELGTHTPLGTPAPLKSQIRQGAGAQPIP